MLGWVIACHDYVARDYAQQLEARFGALPLCRTVDYWTGLSTNMLSRMMCDALWHADGGDGVIFLTDTPGGAPYRVAALMSHKHPHSEVIAGISLPLLVQMYPQRASLDSATFRDAMVKAGGESVTSLWHQQQKNPPFVLLHDK
ncbi:Putative PTS system IIA component yadI [Cronobacter condimenti 1330]|uniref:PTS sugar transporter subunit IIA n=1 Tax=Cronobacter condimenti 1330 TaxID=1073999 RepID=K8A2T6_9ENTR|nr:PTS sugar transporter subunit IIA [Cronobacter condimenti]ALB61691.1 PTS sugar transporter subunit IIA [Cronobacter condimenti 1330]CCJ73645.1 Putative PTS system IIA component yadI [Cronobacter condimenti 1330]